MPGAAYLSEIACFGLPAIRFAREAVQRAADLPVSEGLKIEAGLNTQVFQTEELDEGMAAFLVKHAPRFQGR